MLFIEAWVGIRKPLQNGQPKANVQISILHTSMPDITQENTLNPTDLPYIETSNGVFTLTVIRSEVIHFQ